MFERRRWLLASLLVAATTGCADPGFAPEQKLGVTQQAVLVTCGEPHINLADQTPQPQTLALPDGVFVDTLLLGAAEYLQTTSNTDVSAATVVSMGLSGAVIGEASSVADLYSRGPLTVEDNVQRSGLILSESTVTLGANVDTSNVTQNGSFDPEEVYEYFSLDPQGGPNDNILTGTETLSPGSYGFYNVDGGTLQLSSGVYAFSQLNLESGGELLLDQSTGPIVIHLGSPGTWSGTISVQSGGNPDLLLVYMGTDWLHFDVPTNLFVIAPNAHLAFTDVGPYQGTYYAGEIQVNAAASFAQRDLQPKHFFPPTLPARVEAEDYVRRQDTSHGNNEGLPDNPECDRGDGVDMQLTTDPNGGFCNIGWTKAGEWLEWDLHVEQARNFDITARMASDLTDKSLTIKLDGATVGSLTSPSSGWQSWEDRTIVGVPFSAGEHVLRVEFDTGDTNLNYLEFTERGDTLINATFDVDSQAFSYADDTFRNAAQPDYASGNVSGGALHVELGGIDDTDITNMSGGWSMDFTLSEAMSVDVNFYYALWMTDFYETDECSEVLFSIDGTLFGSGTNDWVARNCGPGNLSGNFHVNTPVLEAGTHTLTLGGFNNQKTFSDEQTTVHIDDVYVFEALE